MLTPTEDVLAEPLIVSNVRLSWTAGKQEGKQFGRQVELWFPLNSH